MNYGVTVADIERGLIIKAPWARALATGQKHWELRNRPTAVRGEVAILEGGTCLVVGVMDVVDCVGPLGPSQLREAAQAGLILPEEVFDADHVTQYAWIVGSARALPEPLPYDHPRGAVVWVRLDPDCAQALAAPVTSRRSKPLM